MFFQQWLAPQKKTGDAAPKTVPTIVQAFAGIASSTTGDSPVMKAPDADTSPTSVPTASNADASATPIPNPPKLAVLNSAAALNTTTGAAEIKKLDDELAKNGEGEYASWARLRAGLIEQYILKNDTAAVKRYEEVINLRASDAVTAQAIYQKGDLLWHKSTTGGKEPSYDAAKTLELLVHNGRGSSAFLDLGIYVPADATNAAKIPSALPAAFELKKVRDLHGDWKNPVPMGILERVNEYYSHTTFYKIFDNMVKVFGSSPNYSYGVSILVFAIFTRLLLQPLNKKQYDSMKGMQLIAPEMKKIQEKYKNKKDQDSQVKMMAEIRALQKSHGVNPMLGCGLAAVQIPVFFYVVSPFIQHYEAKMELVGASFLWIHNLARPDIPLLVVYALSQFLSMRLSSTPPADEQQKQMQTMMMFFPIAVPFFLLTWPSAFTLYWMVFNIMSMVFQYRMMKAADPSKRLVKTLVGQPFIPQIVNPAPSSDVIPARPKDGKAVRIEQKNTNRASQNKVQSNNGTLTEAKSPNGTAKNGSVKNGSANGSGGTAESAEDAGESPSSIVMTGSRNGGSSSGGRARRRRRH